ncbi:MAG: hypothetical protein U5K54_16855 [Cytophagales bacterium]|nr:hypothetical protein [Cytophagales bacterium]
MEKTDDGLTQWWLWEDAEGPSYFISGKDINTYPVIKQPCKKSAGKIVRRKWSINYLCDTSYAENILLFLLLQREALNPASTFQIHPKKGERFVSYYLAKALG